ncbi:MAG: AsmA family protein, partial [Endomicrobia bacterium]|nr:AsmA family protein [Endomicrobiia bacterium]
VLTEEKIRSYVDGASQKYIGRNIKYDKLSFNLIGITLKGFAISEKRGFENGTFAKADKFIINIELKPLFKREIRVNKIGVSGLEINIVKDKDGKFNFDDITQRFASSSQKQEAKVQYKTESSPQNLAAIMLNKFYIKNSKLLFEDLSSDMKITLENLNVNMKDFSFTEKFSADANFKINYKRAGKEADAAISLNLTADLKNMYLTQSYADIHSLKINFENMSILGKAAVKNFSSPDISADITIDSLTNDTIKQFVSNLPKFKLIKAEFSAGIKDMDLKQGYLNLKSLNASVEGMYVSLGALIKNFTAPEIVLNGNVSPITNNTLKSFVKDMPAFNISKLDVNAGLNLDIEKNSAEIKSISVHIPDVIVNASGFINWGKDPKYDIKANANLTLGGLKDIVPEIVSPYDPKGKLDIDAQITQSDIKALLKARDVAFKFEPMFGMEKINADITMASVDAVKISGLSGFLNGKKFNGQMEYLKTKSSLNVNLDLDADGLIINAFPESSKKDAAVKSVSSGTVSVDSLPVNLTANIKAGEIKIPYFYSKKGATINASLTGITDKLDKTNGSVKFNVSGGVIEDAEKLSQANKMTKIAFTSIAIAYKLAKTFNIGGWQGTKDDKLSFDSFNGDLAFVNGKMTAKKMDLISELLTMKITGTADFKADKLDMKASLKPGVNKPVIMKIGGSISKPKGSLDVVSSAVSILGDDKNLNKVIGGLLGGGTSKSDSTADSEKPEAKPSAADVLKSLGNILNKK